MATPPTFARTLVQTFQAGLWRYLRALGVRSAEAEDLLQDTFLVALQKLDRDPGPVATRVFLRRTAKNLLLRRRRDQSRRERLLVENADRLWEESRSDDDGGERWTAALRDCVAGLTGRAQQVVQLFYGEGKGRDGTAAAMGMQANGVRSLLQRTRALLRECIELRLGGER